MRYMSDYGGIFFYIQLKNAGSRDREENAPQHSR
jgi:hypothetical protein